MPNTIRFEMETGFPYFVIFAPDRDALFASEALQISYAL